MEMGAEAVGLGELVTALEQATLMAKQLRLPNTTTLDPVQILQIYSSLHTAHHQLSLFFSHHPPPPPPPPPLQKQQQQQQPSLFPTPPPLENSVSSTVGGVGDDTDFVDPMQVGDDGDDDNEDEHDSMNTTAAALDGVEERMRDCFIQNKRPKRSLSPSAMAAAAEHRRSYQNQLAVRGGSSAEFDPLGTKLRSLDLIYQFHG